MPDISMIVWNEFRNDARVLKEAETLVAAGYKVTILAIHTPGVTKESQILASGVKVKRARRYLPLTRRCSKPAPSNSAKRAARARPIIGSFRPALCLAARSYTLAQLAFWMVRARPDVIHAHDVNTLPPAWLAAKLLRAPLVYDAHEISTDREGYRSLRKWVGWIESKIMPRAAATITPTDLRASFFARAYGISRPVVLQNRPRFSAIGNSGRIRTELGLRDNLPIALYQGGLQRGRGLGKLVDAAAMLENCHIVLIGDGRLAADLREKVSRLALNDRVHFIKTVPLADLPSYTASADIGIQPIENTCLNHFTTDSNKLFEYMMAGLPVVATNLPEIRKLVTSHQFGLLVPSGDSEALSEAIARLAGDGDLRQQFASKARKAAQRLNWEEQEHKLLEIYRQLAPIR